MIKKLQWNYLFNFYLLLSICNLHPTLYFSQQLSNSELDTCKVYQSLTEALKSPENVYILDLSRKKIKVFPVEILTLKNLQKLNLFKNKLDSIPANIHHLKFLRFLNIGKNKLSTFPDGITKLENLKSLILNQNEITSIPDNIDGLYNLEYLDMWSNNLTFISDNIKFLTQLKELDLRVIIFSNDEKDRIKSLLPGAKVYFSNSCNCGY